MNENLEEVAIGKHCKNVLILIEKTQCVVFATELAFKCTNDKLSHITIKDFLQPVFKSRDVYDINRKSVLASQTTRRRCSGLAKFCSILGNAKYLEIH